MNICEIKYYRVIIVKISPSAKHQKSQSKYSNMYQKTKMKLKISKRNPKEPKTKEVIIREKAGRPAVDALRACVYPGKPELKLQGPEL